MDVNCTLGDAYVILQYEHIEMNGDRMQKEIGNHTMYTAHVET